MSATNDPYETLRGGVLSSVSGLSPSTISSWGLQLGERTGIGHPRYGLTDLVAVMLMKHLALDAKLTANRAAFIVRQVRPKLPKIITATRAEWSALKRRSPFGGPCLVVGGGRWGQQGRNEGVRVEIIEEDDLQAVITGAEVPSLIVVSLRFLIWATINELRRHEIESA